MVSLGQGVDLLPASGPDMWRSRQHRPDGAPDQEAETGHRTCMPGGSTRSRARGLPPPSPTSRTQVPARPQAQGPARQSPQESENLPRNPCHSEEPLPLANRVLHEAVTFDLVYHLFWAVWRGGHRAPPRWTSPWTVTRPAERTTNCGTIARTRRRRHESARCHTSGQRAGDGRYDPD